MAIAPERGIYDPSYATLDILDFSFALDATDRTKITISISDNGGIIKSFKLMYVTDGQPFSVNPPTVTINSNSSPIVITGLTPTSRYKVFIVGFSQINQGGNFGRSIEKVIQMPGVSESPKTNVTVIVDRENPNGKEEIIEGITDQTTATPSEDLALKNGLTTNVPRGVLLIAGPANLANAATKKISYKRWGKMVNGIWKSSINVDLPTDLKPVYNTFGTALFFDDKLKNPAQRGGFGFFYDSAKVSGYFIQIQTTVDSVAATTPREVSFFKLINGEYFKISDSQTIDLNQVVGVYSGQIYKIDIKVKSTETQVEIIAYINGFKITATDNLIGKNLILYPKDTIAAYAHLNTNMYLDYVYANSITLENYLDTDSTYGTYSGAYSKSILNTNFGETIFNSQNIDPPVGSIEEFGTVARELRKIKIRYNSRPGKPVYVSTGINKLAAVVGSKLTNFGAEIYVLNNSSSFIPLEDGDTNSFFVLGSTISKTGEYEESSTKLSEFTVEEPLVFASNWIQSKQEAASLETWIKTNWASKQMTVEMTVFGNPFLEVGDLIEINHSYQSLSAQSGNTNYRKFVVLGIDHNYESGLETQIRCRTL
jgi:hypothetical protein